MHTISPVQLLVWFLSNANRKLRSLYSIHTSLVESQSSHEKYSWIYTLLELKTTHRCLFCTYTSKVHQEAKKTEVISKCCRNFWTRNKIATRSLVTLQFSLQTKYVVASLVADRQTDRHTKWLPQPSRMRRCARYHSSWSSSTYTPTHKRLCKYTSNDYHNPV